MPEKKKLKTIKEIIQEAKGQKRLPELIEGFRKNVAKARISEEEIREIYRGIPKEKIEEYRKITKEIGVEPTVQNIVTLYLQEKEILEEEIADIGNFLEHLNKSILRKTSGSFVFLDSSYLMELSKAGLNVEEALRELYRRSYEELGEDFEIVITQQVYEEVKNAIGRKDEKGRFLFKSENLNELHNAIYGTKGNPPVVSLEKIDLEPATVERLSEILQEKSKDKNKRIGKGEASIFQFMFTLGREFDYLLLSSDSDVRVLYRKTYVSL